MEKSTRIYISEVYTCIDNLLQNGIADINHAAIQVIGAKKNDPKEHLLQFHSRISDAISLIKKAVNLHSVILNSHFDSKEERTLKKVEKFSKLLRERNIPENIDSMNDLEVALAVTTYKFENRVNCLENIFLSYELYGKSSGLENMKVFK